MSVKHDNFIRISENRVDKINAMISKLHNLINPSFYEYSDEEIDDMFGKIQEELNNQKQIFINERNKPNRKSKL